MAVPMYRQFSLALELNGPTFIFENSVYKSHGFGRISFAFMLLTYVNLLSGSLIQSPSPFTIQLSPNISLNRPS